MLAFGASTLGTLSNRSMLGCEPSTECSPYLEITTYISMLLYPNVSGLFRIGTSHFYISRGTGTWAPPMRFGVPPEIVAIRLRSPDAPAMALV